MGKYLKKKEPLSPPMGRPCTGVGSSFAPSLIRRITDYRFKHPYWGAKTILAELVHSDGYLATDLPSERTVAELLKARCGVESRSKHRPLDSPQPVLAHRAHECWQMDDKGVEFYAGVGHVGLINIKDNQSHVHTQAFGVPLAHTRCHPNIKDYQCALRLAFSEFGLPQRIQADHGSNFYENKAQSPYPTPLHLWLLGLGVDLVWARSYRPTDQAKVERTHQTLHDQIRQTAPFKSWACFKGQLDNRRHCLNNTIPCVSIGLPPLIAQPKAKHSGRYFSPFLETQIFENQRIKDYLHQKEWFRKVSSAKTISIGGYVYYSTNAKPRTELRIVFDKVQNNFMLYDDKELIDKIKIKGIQIEDLVENDFINKIKHCQLELPIEWENVRSNTTFLHAKISTT